MLDITNCSIQVEDQTVINDISMQFKLGQNYCVLGKNGSGKSSLALTIMGHPAYEITGGDITIEGDSLIDMEPDERAKRGIFLAFQSIPEVKGVKLFEFLRTIYNATTGEDARFLQFKKIIEPLLSELGIDKEFLRRDLNVGFSWGERRKVEILQLKLLQPKYIILDEVDSGLDVDAFRSVAKLLQDINSTDNTFIVITHYFDILDYLPVDHVYVLENGQIVQEGGQDIANQIKQSGFGDQK